MTTKTLFLLRHAKSSWDDPDLPDDKRPLNARGKKAASRMGRYVREKQWEIDLVFCSTAVRAMKTAERFLAEMKHAPTISYVDELYLASPNDMLELLRQVSDDHQRVMLIGHNPGFEEFVAVVTGKSLHFPTAGLATIELELERWDQCDWPLRGKLVRFDRPKEISDH